MRARLRQPLAAVLGVAGLVVGSLALLSTPASAAGDDLVGTTSFTCTMSTFPAYDWQADVTLSAVRPVGSSTVTLSASVSKMAGVSPVALMNYDVTDKLTLEVDGSAVEVKGSGKVSAKAKEAFPMPAMQGAFTSTAADATVAVTSFDFTVLTLAGTCAPTSGADLGTLTIVEGTAPTPTPTPTTTTSATATPTASTSASASATPTSSAAVPAEGKADFACTMSIGSTFDWKPALTVSGYREAEGDPVSLVASMSDMPGMSPVPIEGSMDYALDLEVEGEKTTLTSTGTVSAQAKEVVPVADLTGEVDVDGDELEVVVTGFSFDFPSAGVGAECTANKVSIGTLTVGSDPIDTDGDDGGDDGSTSSPAGTTSGGTTVTGGTLPKTGGADATPVIVLWAGAFVLLGAAVLLIVPGRTRRAVER